MWAIERKKRGEMFGKIDEMADMHDIISKLKIRRYYGDKMIAPMFQPRQLCSLTYVR
jgi:hypothetical protein